jgi:hypothetical protein
MLKYLVRLRPSAGDNLPAKSFRYMKRRGASPNEARRVQERDNEELIRLREWVRSLEDRFIIALGEFLVEFTTEVTFDSVSTFGDWSLNHRGLTRRSIVAHSEPAKIIRPKTTLGAGCRTTSDGSSRLPDHLGEMEELTGTLLRAAFAVFTIVVGLFRVIPIIGD